MIYSTDQNGIEELALEKFDTIQIITQDNCVHRGLFIQKGKNVTSQNVFLYYDIEIAVDMYDCFDNCYIDFFRSTSYKVAPCKKVLFEKIDFKWKQ